MSATGRARLMDDAGRLIGTDRARLAADADVVGRVRPILVVEPATPDELATVVAWAARERLRLTPRGNGTKLDWGGPLEGSEVIVSTSRLSALVEHAEGDLVATVEAGASLADTNALLERHRQRIPLDPCFRDRATIGGIVATNDSGPLRHRHGSPRDLLIGIGVARADGRLAKAGGKVVKNVAGYDLGKLFSGSFGTLGIIATATFKLAPLPAACRTVVTETDTLGDVAAFLKALAASHLEPAAVEVQHPPTRILVRFQSAPRSVEEQSLAAHSLASSHHLSASVIDGPDEETLWHDHAARPWQGAGAVIKLSVVPSDSVPTLHWLDQQIGRAGATWEVCGRAGLGLLLLRIDADAATQAAMLERLRRHVAPGQGSSVLLRGSEDLRSRVDGWGPLGDGAPLMRAVKASFDPQGILNPGRGPGGV